MFKIGEKVEFDGMVGYIVKIEIDPLDEYDYDLRDPASFVTYAVRVFKPFYQYGYFDFQRTQTDLVRYEG